MSDQQDPAPGEIDEIGQQVANESADEDLAPAHAQDNPPARRTQGEPIPKGKRKAHVTQTMNVVKKKVRHKHDCDLLV